MSATPIRRHRLAASLAGVVLGLGLLASCSGQRAPGNYSDKVERDFRKGCVKTAQDDKVIVDPRSYCECAYAALSDKQSGVDFDEFKSVNNDQTEDPKPLPAKFTKVFAKCSKESGSASAPTTTEGSGGDTTTTGG